MTTYNNGPGNVPRLPDRVVDTLIYSAGVSCAAPGRSVDTWCDQTANVERLVHAVCEELLARLPTAATPAAPVLDAGAAPVGRTLAWLVDPGAGSASDKLTRVMPDKDQLADIARRGGSVTELVARPFNLAERKPLTGAEIGAIKTKVAQGFESVGMATFGGIAEVVRLTEQHHGITGGGK